MVNTMRQLALAIALGFIAAPAFAQPQAEVVYYHTDAIGSVRMVTDANGAVVARYDYLPFGELWPASPPNANPDVRQFTGKERDAETGLDYFGARYMRAQSGRFLAIDPVFSFDAALSNPQLWNRYAYVANNPFRFVDPDGRQVLDVNLQKMLELLKAPVTAAGRVRGPLIQEAARVGAETIFGELFGYNPHAFGGGLTFDEYVSSNGCRPMRKALGCWALEKGTRRESMPSI
jgi:RHS repeat-associated protein